MASFFDSLKSIAATVTDTVEQTASKVTTAVSEKVKPAAPAVLDITPERLAKVKKIPEDGVSSLRKVLGDRLVLAGQPKYEECRRLGHPANEGGKRTSTWNLATIGAPAAFASPISEEEISACVKFASQYLHGPGGAGNIGIPICVAGGRHSSMCIKDDAFVVDLSAMKKVTVDVAGKTCVVQGGALQQDLMDAVLPHNLIVTVGHDGSTGCGGLTLQGGHGYLERHLGLAVDSLLECRVVLADGSAVTCNATENDDLFWALRGGGGSFGIVVSFKFQLHPIPEKIYAGQRIHVPLGKGWFVDRPAIISSFMKLLLDGPDQASGLLIVPSGGPVIEQLLFTGDEDTGRYFFAQHKKECGYPLKDSMGSTTYAAVQAWAPMNTGHFYQTGVLLPKMSDEVAEAIGNLMSKERSPGSHVGAAIILLPLGGAVARVDPTATANPYRKDEVWVLVSAQINATPGTDEYAAATKACKEFVQVIKTELKPFSVGNYGVLSETQAQGAGAGADDDGSGGNSVIGEFIAHRDTFGVNLPRLQSLKHKYDPANLFYMNDNVLPKA